MKILERIRRMEILMAVVSLLIGVIMVIYPQKTMSIICYAIAAAILIYGIVDIISYFTAKSYDGAFSLTLLKGIIASVIGIVIFINPKYLATFIPIVLGILLIIDGITSIQKSVFLKNNNIYFWHISMIESIITFAFGIFVLINPLNVEKAIIICLGIAFIWYGISSVWNYLYVQKKINFLRQAEAKNDIIDID